APAGARGGRDLSRFSIRAGARGTYRSGGAPGRRRTPHRGRHRGVGGYARSVRFGGGRPRARAPASPSGASGFRGRPPGFPRRALPAPRRAQLPREPAGGAGAPHRRGTSGRRGRLTARARAALTALLAISVLACGGGGGEGKGSQGGKAGETVRLLNVSYDP